LYQVKPGSESELKSILEYRFRVLCAGLVFVILLGLAPPGDRAGIVSSANAAEEDQTKDLVMRGDAVCTRCHEETEAGPSLLIGKSRHGTMADENSPTCTSCHGESAGHVDIPDGVDVRPMVDYFDRRDHEKSASEQNQLCIQCHQGGELIHWQGSLHGAQEVACASCHKMHVQYDPVVERDTQAEVCLDCHKEKRSEINRVSRHPTKEGQVICGDCHASHGSAGRALMRRDTVIDTCYQCHAEKRGPFIWNHQPVTEDCTICHNPHGSNVANLLKWRPPFLCQQCHEATSHRGSLPSMSFGARPSNNMIARGCTNCHTNIHGSNSPVGGNGRPRAFVR
jgi:DmsE family decaheme c-type cytochrome